MPMKATEYVTALSSVYNDKIVDDETNDHNLRYIGADPNNYVRFNGELWRIIGVMNDVADENGVIEPRIKLIRRTSIGYYSYDNRFNGDSSSQYEKYGYNDWSDSNMQLILNDGAYYNRGMTQCPSGYQGGTSTCNFRDSGLTDEAKSMINKVKWKLGGSSTYKDVTANMFYTRERGTNVYSGHATEWTGEVGLIYLSDFGYATGGGSTTNRNVCLSIALYDWLESDCYINDWLKGSKHIITPYSANSYYSFNIAFSSKISITASNSPNEFFPSVYLNPSLKISSGTGSSTDPFVLGV